MTEEAASPQATPSSKATPTWGQRNLSTALLVLGIASHVRIQFKGISHCDLHFSRLLSMTQEHGRVEPISGNLDYKKFPIGAMLYLIPYHVSNSSFFPGFYEMQWPVQMKDWDVKHSLCRLVLQPWCMPYSLSIRKGRLWTNGHLLEGGDVTEKAPPPLSFQHRKANFAMNGHFSTAPSLIL